MNSVIVVPFGLLSLSHMKLFTHFDKYWRPTPWTQNPCF
nr:MAG TPA: hypothetical protein [Caudoviricetes sp.]